MQSAVAPAVSHERPVDHLACAPRASAEDLIAAVPLFRNLKLDASLRALVDGLGYRDVAAGEVLIRQADIADGVYFVLAGRVAVHVDGIRVATLGAGESFGEMGLFGGTTRSAEVIALEPALCAFLHREQLERAMAKAPRLATNLMRQLSERVRALNGMLLALRLAPPSAPAVVPRIEADAVDATLSLLRAVPIFTDVPDERFLRRVAGLLQPVDVAAGTLLFSQGDAGDRLYLVVEGTLRVHLDELELTRLGPGSHFGEMALLDGAPRSAGVTTETACRLLTLTQAQFFAAVAQAPVVARGILSTLSDRVRRINHLVASEGDSRPSAARVFPETAATSLWERDPDTGRWQMPLPQAVAEDYAGIETETEAATDGFAEALRIDAAALKSALHERHGATVASPDFGRLVAMADALVGRLRSPLMPRRAYGAWAKSLHELLVGSNRTLDLRMVLASPTALAELPDFLAVARLVRDAGFSVTPRLLVVRWENWVDVRELTHEARREAFHECLRELEAATAAAGFPDARITPIDIEAAPTLDQVVAPEDFATVFRRVAAAATNIADGEAGLVRNLLWISGFYARQRSLQRLGPVQPPFDLAIRMAIGERVAAMPAEGVALLLTSELNQRFLNCYGPDLSIANIALGGSARGNG
jgi:CRP-like cAMP-binding protein